MDDGCWRYWAPLNIVRWAGTTDIVRGNARTGPKLDKVLARGLCRAHALVKAARAGSDSLWGELAKSEGAAPSYVRRLSRLALLAPDIQEAIMEGRQPVRLNLEKLMRIDLPLRWQDQRELLGFCHA